MEKDYSFRKSVLKPTTGQIVANVMGFLLYGTYHIFHDDLFGIPQTYANLRIYISDMTAIVLICTFSFMGNRYISLRFFSSRKTPGEILKNNFLQLVLSSIFFILVFNGIFGPVFYINNPDQFVEDITVSHIYGVPFVFIFYFVDYTLRTLDEYRSLLIDLKRVEKEKLYTELQLLRAQFNPHFIFNAINIVYFQIQDENAQNNSVLPRFKQMINYLASCTEEYVSLNDELKYLNNYIEIQMLRIGEDINLDVEIDEHSENVVISPFVLQPFVENAFKYISGNMELKVKLNLVGYMLQYSVFNSIDEQFYAFNETKGVGHANLKKRLEIIYPNKHLFECKNVKRGYLAEMKLELRKK